MREKSLITFICLNCDKSKTVGNYSNHTKKYCNSDCAGEHRSKLNLERNILLLREGKLRDRNSLRRVLVHLGMKYECSVCHIKSWQDKPLTLWVDHIDGNAANNIQSNFRFICPNCESQSSTFGGRNKGNGRILRKLPSWY